MYGPFLDMMFNNFIMRITEFMSAIAGHERGLLFRAQFHKIFHQFAYVLQLSPLPGGTTEDYASHIHGCLDSIVKTC